MSRLDRTLLISDDENNSMSLPLVHVVAVLKSTENNRLRHILSEVEVNRVLILGDNLVIWESWKDDLIKTGLPVFRLGVGGSESLLYQSTEHSLPQRGIKRVGDILVALLGLVITALVAAMIYPIVRKQSPGSLFFKQKRVGKNGRHFEMYKFRSMYLDAEERKQELLSRNQVNSELMFKLDNDPRVFPFGQKMRDLSIDELPQFINVLKGDMSLIGTRPPTVDEVSRYELHHFKRLAIKPGITGMWQVSGRSNIIDFEEVVKLDVSYIDNWSLWLDLKILLKTIKVVLLKEGSR